MEPRELAATESSAKLEAAPAVLLLKATASRLQRDLLARPRLLLGAARFREVPAVLVQAPGGYGKTSLLAQWRQESLGTEAIVLWLTTGPADTPQRLLRSLVLAFAMPLFSRASARLLALPDPVEGLTEWLAEVARSALDTVLVLDEVERLPAGSFEALAYLLRAPGSPPRSATTLTSAGATPSPACWRRCSPRRSGCGGSRARRSSRSPTGSTSWSIAGCPRRCSSPSARCRGSPAERSEARALALKTLSVIQSDTIAR